MPIDHLALPPLGVFDIQNFLFESVIGFWDLVFGKDITFLASIDHRALLPLAVLGICFLGLGIWSLVFGILHLGNTNFQKINLALPPHHLPLRVFGVLDFRFNTQDLIIGI